MKLALPAITLLAFTAFSATVVAEHGLLGFVELTANGGWALQMFLDIVIALVLFMIWMVPDARERGLPWPVYVVATLALGSIGALAYLVHRAVAEPRSGRSLRADAA